MTAADFELLDEAEAEQIIRRRFKELIAAGYAWDEALKIAAHVEVDVHVAAALLHTGCPSSTAVRILL